MLYSCSYSCRICYINAMLLLLLSRFSRVRLLATPRTAAHQAPPSMGLSRQENWSGVPCKCQFSDRYDRMIIDPMIFCHDQRLGEGRADRDQLQSFGQCFSQLCLYSETPVKIRDTKAQWRFCLVNTWMCWRVMYSDPTGRGDGSYASRILSQTSSYVINT